MRNVLFVFLSILLFEFEVFSIPNNNDNKYFKIALALPQRHASAEELEPDLIRYKQKGYTGIWIEDDFLRWTWEKDPDQGFGGNWRLFNMYDFTFRKDKKIYVDYLTKLCALCKKHDLDIYCSFWMPKLTDELIANLEKDNPDAIGIRQYGGSPETSVPKKTLCTCKMGKGLKFIDTMVQKFMNDFPQVKGLKVAIEDNECYICDASCPNSKGTEIAEHAANLLETIQQAMLHVRKDAHFLLYPWFWQESFKQAVLSRLTGEYFVVTKMEMNSRQDIEKNIPGDRLWDCSIITDQPGPDFLEWVKRVGADHIINMTPTGTNIDDFFLANPPFPGRLYRYFKNLQANGVDKFLDFECGGHHQGANEEAVALFNENPNLSETEFLEEIAKRMFHNKKARDFAIKGWQSFDKGFACLPIGISDNGCWGNSMSGRLGFAWAMCIATPFERSCFGEKDQMHKIHYFSPYNFFTTLLSDRLSFHFNNVLKYFEDSYRNLSIADELEGSSEVSQVELAAVHGQVLSVQSALNWCAAAKFAEKSSRPNIYEDIIRKELKLTEEMKNLTNKYPWLWSNNCWHPHQTPLSQRIPQWNYEKWHNTFDAKIDFLQNLVGFP